MKQRRRELIRDDLKNTHWLGVIVNPSDPDFKGRAQIRVFGKFDELEDVDLPWAHPKYPNVFGNDGSSAAFSYPKKGTVVHVTFNNGNVYAPEYSAIQELSKDLIEEIKGSYENSHVLVYDTVIDGSLKVFYTEQSGMKIELDESIINIATDNSITIEHKGTSSIIELKGNTINIIADSEVNITGTSRVKIDSAEVWANGKETKVGHVPAYSAVLAEPLWAFLKSLASTVDAKLYATPGAMAGAAAAAEQLSTSKTVKVSQ